ncbi:hypothetical protein P8452_55367 [Trifolium repens]|nr:hypothetical protein P8452_55367 [Trifolium repens]
MWKAFEVGRRIESVMVPLELMQQLRLFTQLWISLLIPGRIMSLCSELRLRNVGSKVWMGNVMPLLKLHLYELRIAKVGERGVQLSRGQKQRITWLMGIDQLQFIVIHSMLYRNFIEEIADGKG